MPPSFSIVRATVLGTTNVLALIVLCLAAYTLTVFSPFYFTFSALGVSTAVLHLVSVTAMLSVGHMRNGALTSRVSVEVSWLSFLCVMWLSTGAHTAATWAGIIRCRGGFCPASQAIAALGFLNWIILLGYIMILIGAVVRASQAGRNLWMADVKDIQLAPGPGLEKGITSTPNPTGATYPPGSFPPGAPPPAMPQYHPQPAYQQQQYGPPQV